MKFDAIVGNPPYQNGNQPIWKHFVKQALERADSVAFVTPRSVLNGRTDPTGARGSYFETMQGHIRWLDYSADDHFSVSKSILGWVYDRNYTGPATVIDEEGQASTVDTTKFSYMPYVNTPTAMRVFERMTQQPTFMTEWRIETKHKTVPGPHLVMPKSAHVSIGSVIHVTDLATDARVTSRYTMTYPAPSANSLTYIHSELYRYMFHILGGDDGNTVLLLRKIPLVDLTRAWTDQELYEHFNIDQADQAVIAQRVKRKK